MTKIEIRSYSWDIKCKTKEEKWIMPATGEKSESMGNKKRTPLGGYNEKDFFKKKKYFKGKKKKKKEK